MTRFFFQAEDGIRDIGVTGVQTCALPIFAVWQAASGAPARAARKVRRESMFFLGPCSRGVSPQLAGLVPGCVPWAQQVRSEERRVGKEGRSWWSPYH